MNPHPIAWNQARLRSFPLAAKTFRQTAVAFSSALFALALLAGPISSAHAVTYHWDADGGSTGGLGGTGAWNTTSSLWRTPTTGSALTTWPTSGTDNDASFGGTAGTVTIAAGGVTANDLSFSTHLYTVAGDTLTFNGTTPTVTVPNGMVTTLSAPLAGSAAIAANANGAGVLFFDGNNTSLIGGVNVNSGFSVVRHSNGFGTGTVVVANGATSQVELNGINVANAFSIAGNGALVGARGAIGQFIAGTMTISGPITMTANSGIFVRDGAGNLTLSGAIGESGGSRSLTKLDGAGTLTLSGASSNTYTGATTVVIANMVLSKTGGAVAIPGNLNLGTGSVSANPVVNTTQPNQFGATSVISFLNNGATTRLQLLGNSQTVAGISDSLGSGVIQNGGQNLSTGTSATLTINNTASFSYNGTIRDFENVASSALSLIKAGAGTQTLAGSNISYTGSTTVNGGTLTVTGSLANNGSTKIFMAAPDDTLAGNPILTRSRAASSSYAGFGSTTTGGLLSSADILAGTNSTGSDNTVTMQWRLRTALETTNPIAAKLLSEVLSLTGMGNGGAPVNGYVQTDPFVLQMSYDESLVDEANAALGAFFLGTFDSATSNWVKAVSGNFTGTPAFFNRGYISGTDGLAVGRYGVDTTNNVAWAIVDHNSLFAVVPEPGTFAMLLLGWVGLGLIARKRLA